MCPLETVELEGFFTIRVRSVRSLTGAETFSFSPDPTSATAGDLVETITATTYTPEPGLSRRTVTTIAANFSQTTDSFLYVEQRRHLRRPFPRHGLHLQQFYNESGSQQ
ncbi:MAG: hypothetical protein ACNA8L_12065 [Luteolibacter sp.]